jgi:predicted Zn-dependent protease
MQAQEIDFSHCSALVVDPNPTTRSILVSQLREYGVGTVLQTARAADARRHLEYRVFDFVLCEQYFDDEAISGPDLLDDLRRNHLLPYAAIFILITAEATYAKVAEAAESALDGYLLKPHRAVDLFERVQQARLRKIELQDIFGAIDTEDFELAAQLCLQRFESRSLYWLYAARVGAELLLRLGRCAEAQTLYQAVVAAKTLPWARLGIARAQLDAGQITQATSTLERLIDADPTFVDAYDVMGRAYIELGRFDRALETFKMAAALTPASISRMQNLAMMSYYAGDRKDADKLLERTTRMGLESKLFDSQSLVLLAFTRLEQRDRKGVQRCQDDFVRLLERNPDNARQQRLAGIVSVLNHLAHQEFEPAAQAVRAMAGAVSQPDFDFESAANVLALLCQLAHKAIGLNEWDGVVETIGMRFCSNRSLAELLAASTASYPPYAERVRGCQDRVLAVAEAAVTQSMNGDPTAAIHALIDKGQATLNARLIENATQLLQKHATKVQGAEALALQLHTLRQRCGAGNVKASLGQHGRQAGSLAIRIGATKHERPSVSPQNPTY